MALAKAYNGWTASKTPADIGGLDNRVIPGTAGAKYAPGIRAGSVATIAFWFGWQWHTRIEPIVAGTCWGHYWKQSANSASLLSCHAAGAAWDTMAPSHPNGKRGTLTGPALEKGKTKLQVLREVLAYLEGTVYSGVDAWGDGTPDEMHAEIATGTTQAKVDAVAAKILRDFGPIDSWAKRSPSFTAAPALTFPVAGSIAAAFTRAGGLAALGQPKGPEVPTGDQAGRWQEFANGSAWWHPRFGGPAHAVQGDIARRFTALGREVGFGWPVTDELTAPDRVGRFTHFDGDRSIYWTPATGAQPVQGAIRAAWAAHGWETGKLGYPTSGETPAEGGIVQSFQRGSVVWKDGRATIRTST